MNTITTNNTNSTYANANVPLINNSNISVTSGHALNSNPIGPLLASALDPYNEGFNFKIIKANGGFILEVCRNNSMGYASSINKYILKEKNIGKQIEKIIALEILKK
jgi:hypothetical protein